MTKGIEFILGEMKHSKINCGDGCTTLSILETIKLYTLNG